jgi:carbamoyl-phosphate synthase large subunit
MAGATIASLRAEGLLPAEGDGAVLPAGSPVSVKEAVMPFHRFRRPDGTGVDTLLGPEMRSTGEVMGIDMAFGPAFAKSQTASYGSLPTKGTVFVSVANADKRAMVFPAKRLADLGFTVLATEGTADMLQRNGIHVQVVRKHTESAAGATVVELIKAGQVDLVINTPYGQSGPRIDGYEIRTAAVAADIPCITTIAGAAAVVQGIEALIRSDVGVAPLQVLQTRLRDGRARVAAAAAAVAVGAR